MKVNDNGVIISFKDDDQFTKSSISSLYNVDNKVYKLFFNNNYNSSCKLEREVYNLLKDHNTKAFMNIDKTFAYKNGVYVENNRSFIIDGYRYDYLDRNDNKMIDLPMDYTFKSIDELIKFVTYLNKKGILIRDACSSNCIVGNDNLVVIDPDYYELDNYAFKDNLNEMTNYISDLWCEEYGISEHCDKYKIFKELYSKDIDSYLYNIEQILTSETPREYLDDVVKTLKITKTI